MEIGTGRLVLRDFVAEDRPAFVAYQTDPRYASLYGSDAASARLLFERFLFWQVEAPRRNFQLGVFARERGGALLGCIGMRELDEAAARAVFGIELAPEHWGRFGLAIEASSAMLGLGFDRLRLVEIVGVTSSGNTRVRRLARWFGAVEASGTPDAPCWRITRAAWQECAARRRFPPSR